MAGGIMLWALALSFTHMTEASPVIPPAQQQQISAELEHDAEVMSNTQLQQQITGEPKAVQDEVLAINAHAPKPLPPGGPAHSRHRITSGSGQLISHASRLPDIPPTVDIEGVGLG